MRDVSGELVWKTPIKHGQEDSPKLIVGFHKGYSVKEGNDVTVRKLQKAGISNDKIAAITGHRNEQSLRDYSTVDLEDHKAIGTVLCNSNPFQSVTNSQSKTPLFSAMSSCCSSRPTEPYYNAQCTLAAILYVPRLIRMVSSQD